MKNRILLLLLSLFCFSSGFSAELNKKTQIPVTKFNFEVNDSIPELVNEIEQKDKVQETPQLNKKAYIGFILSVVGFGLPGFIVSALGFGEIIDEKGKYVGKKFAVWGMFLGMFRFIFSVFLIMMLVGI